MIIMKKIFFAPIFILVISSMSYAQKFRGTDKSPMDMAYYPIILPTTENQERALLSELHTADHKRKKERLSGN